MCLRGLRISQTRQTGVSESCTAGERWVEGVSDESSWEGSGQGVFIVVEGQDAASRVTCGTRYSVQSEAQHSALQSTQHTAQRPGLGVAPDAVCEVRCGSQHSPQGWIGYMTQHTGCNTWLRAQSWVGSTAQHMRRGAAHSTVPEAE